MRESHYNMYMKNLETLDSIMGHYVQQQASRQKKTSRLICVQMYRTPFLYFPGAPQYTKSAPD